jgi:hypothetical protein
MGDYNDFNKRAPTWVYGEGPQDWFFEDDFNELNVSGTRGAAKWTLDKTDAAATALLDQDLGGGVLELTQAANDNDVISLFASSGFQLSTQGLANAISVRFGCRFQVTDADDCDIHLGLAPYDASMVASENNDLIAFRLLDGSAGLDLRVGKDGTYQTGDNLIAVADATMVRAFFEFIPTSGNTDSGTLYYTIHSNGSRILSDKLTLTNTFPDDLVIFPFIQFQNGAASADVAKIDWIYAHCIRAAYTEGTG